MTMQYPPSILTIIPPCSCCGNTCKCLDAFLLHTTLHHHHHHGFILLYTNIFALLDVLTFLLLAFVGMDVGEGVFWIHLLMKGKNI